MATASGRRLCSHKCLIPRKGEGCSRHTPGQIWGAPSRAATKRRLGPGCPWAVGCPTVPLPLGLRRSVGETRRQCSCGEKGQQVSVQIPHAGPRAGARGADGLLAGPLLQMPLTGGAWQRNAGLPVTSNSPASAEASSTLRTAPLSRGAKGGADC